MYEYHCWAVLPDFGDREAEGRLEQELRDRIAEVDEGSRESFNVTTLNTLMVAASGLRNHSQPFVIGVFEWIAENWPGSYGLLYIHPEHPDEDGWRFHVQKISAGRMEYLEDRYFPELHSPLG
jgi:hypothetical protein